MYTKEMKCLHQELQEVSETFQGKLLTPFQRKLLIKNLTTNLRSEYRRRIEIMLLADLGQSQTEICTALNCSHETARYWIFMAQTGQAHQWKEIPIGRPKTINPEYLERLQELVDRSPKEFGYSFERWTAQWLSKHLAKELEIEVSDRHINRLLKKMGRSTKNKQTKVDSQTADRAETDDSGIVIRNLISKSKPNLMNFGPFKP